MNITAEKPGRSKFAARFNMTGSGMTQTDDTDQARSSVNTPSTSTATPPSEKGPAVKK